MIWQQLKVLLPSIVLNWFALTALALVAWFAWTRIYKSFAFKWTAPVLVASAFWSYGLLQTIVNLYQGQLINEYNQKLQANTPQQSQQQPQQQGQQAAVDPVVQMKNNFLSDVNKIVSDPSKLSQDLREQFFKAYAPLFKDDKDRADAIKQVVGIFDCQRYFWEDALASFKTKSAFKSDSRKQCESMSGSFFGRDKLIPAEVAKSNEEAIIRFAARKRMPSSDGKEIEVTEDMLRESLDAQIRNQSTAKALLK